MFKKESTKANKPKKPLPIRLAALIPIFLIVGAIIVFNIFFLNSILKSSLKNYAEKKNGAKVDIGLFDLGLGSLSLKIKDVAWTDVSDPMLNLFSFDQMSMDVIGTALFYKKIHMKEIKLTGFKLNSQRQKSGAFSLNRKDEGLGATLSKEQESKQEKVVKVNNENNNDEKEQKKQLVDDSDDIKNQGDKQEKVVKVNNENNNDEKEQKKQLVDLDGISTKIADSLKSEVNKVESEVQTKVNEWEQQAKQVGDIRDIKNNVSDIKKINPSSYKNIQDVPKLKKDLDTIKDTSNNLQNKKKDIEKARDKVLSEHKSLNAKIDELKSLRDKKLKEELLKILSDRNNIENATELIFGPEVAEKLGTYFDYYEKYSSYLPERSKSSVKEEIDKESPFKGVSVDFTGKKKAPSFLLVNLELSGELSSTLPILGTIKTLSSDLTWKPVRIDINGLNKSTPFRLNGTLSKVKKTGLADHKLSLSFKNVDLKDTDLFKGNNVVEGLRKGKADIYSILTDNGKEVKIDSTILGRDWSLEIKKLDNPILNRVLQTTLSKLPSIKIQAILTVYRRDNKRSRDVTLDLKSDLDKKLNASLKEFFSNEVEVQKDQLKKLTLAKSDKVINPLVKQLGINSGKGFDDSLKELNYLDKLLKDKESNIKNRIKDLEQEGKNKVNEKIKEVTKDLKKKLPF